MKSDFRSIASLVMTAVAMAFTIFPAHPTIRGKRVTLGYAVVPPVVTALLCATTLISWETVVRGMLGPASPEKYRDETSHSSLIPLTVIALFFGLAYTCVSAAQSGLFKLVAWKFKQMALRARDRRLAGMCAFYAFAGVFTLCTSNDIVILCLTPIILEFIRQTGDSKALIPMLLNQFCAANTFSIALLTGNPSNFILTSVFGIDFISYLRPMILPGLAAGAVVFVYTFVMLRREKTALEPLHTQ